MTKKQILPYLEIFLVLLFTASFYFPGIYTTKFHIDEAHWISTSNMFESYVKGDFTSAIWHESHTTLTNPPVPRYLIGVSRYIGGYRLPDLNKLWDYEKSVNFNTKVGAMPSPGLLWWSRLPMAILAMFSLTLGYFFAKEIGGRAAGIVWLLLGVFNPFLITMLDRAMAESSILFFTLLSIIFCFVGMRTYPSNKWNALLLLIATGICIGLAASAKMNGFGSIVGVAFVILIVAWKENSSNFAKLNKVIGVSILVTLASVLIFWAAYPYLWQDPVGRTLKMFNNRISEMTYQTGQHSPDHIDTIQERIVLLPARIFQDYALIRFPGAVVVNIGFSILGMVLVIKKAFLFRNGIAEGLLPLIIFSVGVFAALPTLFTMLDWDRYYLFPVVFSSFFMAIGIAWVLEKLMATLKKQISKQA